MSSLTVMVHDDTKKLQVHSMVCRGTYFCINFLQFLPFHKFFPQVRKSSAEIERNDSGVGSETSKCSRSRWQHLPASCIREDQQHSCEDCDQPVETQVTDR